MSLIDTLDPILIPWAQQLFDLAQRAGVHPQVTSARRSYAQQAALYKRFQEGRSRFPVAVPGTSAHEWGLAFDMVVPDPTDQHDLGTVWVSWGGVYGGAYDPVHFEYPGFRTAIGAGAPISRSPLPTAGSTTSTVQGLADEIVLALPTPLRGILNTAEVANALLAVAGANPYAYGIQWMLTHPAELTQAFLNVAWNLLLRGT